jgi:phospholipid/cholesterol/gamma-HCH transport system substrate-binding protein
VNEQPEKPKAADYDERIYRKGHPPHRMRNALILIGLVLIGSYLAVTKSLPFGSEYELRAVFQNAANIRKDSPVRIAGVNVGKVTGVRSVGDAAEVTFTVEDEGRPIREDAQVEIRPRIFLEGNFFFDVKPGSPSAPELPDRGVIPISNTSTAVQLDQILTTLQAPDRENLSKLLQGYGTALNYQPTAADDKGHDPDVQGETAGQAINDSFEYGGPAGRDSAIVSRALLGNQPEQDLSGLIASQADVFNALLEREAQLKDFITNLNVTAGAFAAESDNLAESVKLLAPTLERAEPALRHTNESFPFLRAFARDIQPGLRELPATIAVSGPWLEQTKALLAKDELGAIADELRLTGPPAGLAAAAGAGLFSQTELLSLCASRILIPTGNVVLNDQFNAGVPNFKEFGYALTQVAGAAQNFDGNGPFVRFQAGGGEFGANGGLVGSNQPGGGFENETLFGHSILPPVGTQPVLGAKPELRTDVPCHVNAIPDLNGPAATPGPPSPAAVP